MKKILARISVLGILAVVMIGAVGLFGTFGVSDFISHLSSNPDGIVFAAAGAAVVTEGAPSTTDTEAAASPELLDESISKVITRISPSATPLDTILRSVGRDVDIKTWKTKYYAVDLRGINDALGAAFVADDAAYSTITIGNGHIWSVDDTALVHGIAGADGNDLVLHIVDKPSATTLDVIALNGYETGSTTTGTGLQVPNIADATLITRLGNAKSELDVTTSPYSIYPQPVVNYCQIHMAQVEESLYAKMHAQEVKWDINDFYTQAIFDLRRQMELTSLFGYAPAAQPVYDPKGLENKYFSGGITRFITKGSDYTAGSLAQDDMVKWAKTAFTGNSGADERVMFVGKDLMEEISNISITKNIDAKNTEVKWGIRFNTIETNFGRFLLKHHRLFDDVGWSKKALVLDMNNIERHVFKKFEDLELDLRTSGQKNVNANVISEAFCVAVRYPDTHMIITTA